MNNIFNAIASILPSQGDNVISISQISNEYIKMSEDELRSVLVPSDDASEVMYIRKIKRSARDLGMVLKESLVSDTDEIISQVRHAPSAIQEELIL